MNESHERDDVIFDVIKKHVLVIRTSFLQSDWQERVPF